MNYDNDDVILSLPRDNALLEDAIIEHQIAPVVIDPLMSVRDRREDRHHRERERFAQRSILWLRWLTEPAPALLALPTSTKVPALTRPV